MDGGAIPPEEMARAPSIRIPNARITEHVGVSIDAQSLQDARFILLRIGSTLADGEPTVALVHSSVASELQTLPEFPVSFCHPLSSYRIASAGSSGLGMFACSSLERGHIILHERPLLVYPQLVPFHHNRPLGREYTELEDALLSMSPQNRQFFYTLMNSQTSEPSSIKGIIDTNALYLGVLPGSSHQYAAVCRDISRINHSCSPNAVYRFNLDTFSFELRALFPISPGEQIFISYIDPALPLSSRQSALSGYGFTCKCTSCSLSDPLLAQSETRRSLIARADADVDMRDAALERWAHNPNLPDNYVNRVDRMYMDLFEKERLYYEPVWEGFAVRLCKACCAVEDHEGARHWATLAADLNRAYTGDDRGWAAVQVAPERTEWWGLRKKARSPDVL